MRFLPSRESCCLFGRDLLSTHRALSALLDLRILLCAGLGSAFRGSDLQASGLVPPAGCMLVREDQRAATLPFPGWPGEALTRGDTGLKGEPLAGAVPGLVTLHIHYFMQFSQQFYEVGTLLSLCYS